MNKSFIDRLMSLEGEEFDQEIQGMFIECENEETIMKNKLLKEKMEISRLELNASKDEARIMQRKQKDSNINQVFDNPAFQYNMKDLENMDENKVDDILYKARESLDFISSGNISEEISKVK